MGVWGTDIFGSDIACDVRDHYRELIEDGVADAEAWLKTVEKFQKSFDDPEDGTTAILALAVTQSKIGRLDPSLRDRALAVIDRGGDLDLWAQDDPKGLGKRKVALEKARAQLTGIQPARKRLKAPRRRSCELAAGDVLALDLPGGPVLLRTVHVRSHRRGESPTLELLDFHGPEVPPAEVIQQLPGTAADDARFTAMFDAGWKEAGFRKVAQIAARDGDELLIHQSCGYVWSGLADRYRARRASDGERPV